MGRESNKDLGCPERSQLQMKNKSWALFKLARGGWSEEIGERILGDRHSLSRHCPQHMRDTVSGRSRKGRGQKQLMMGPVWEDLQNSVE